MPLQSSQLTCLLHSQMRSYGDELNLAKMAPKSIDNIMLLGKTSVSCEMGFVPFLEHLLHHVCQVYGYNLKTFFPVYSYGVQYYEGIPSVRQLNTLHSTDCTTPPPSVRFGKDFSSFGRDVLGFGRDVLGFGRDALGSGRYVLLSGRDVRSGRDVMLSGRDM